jgi:hypothetical protein
MLPGLPCVIQLDDADLTSKEQALIERADAGAFDPPRSSATMTPRPAAAR